MRLQFPVSLGTVFSDRSNKEGIAISSAKPDEEGITMFSAKLDEEAFEPLVEAGRVTVNSH